MGLGHVPGVPRQRRPPPEGRERAAVRADRAAAHLGAGLRARQGRPLPDRRRAARAPPPARTRRWTPAAAAGRRSGSIPTGPAPCSATTTAGRWSPTSCTTRPRSSLARCSRERNAGLHADDARHREPRHDFRALRGARRGQRPAGALQRRAGVRPLPDAHRAQLAVARPLPPARRPRVRAGRHHRRRLHLHVRGLEPLRRRPPGARRRPARPGERRRSSPIPRAARRCATSLRASSRSPSTTS